MSSGSSSSSSGIGVIGLLGVAFVVLKLTHVIDWSWWWVTAPFWGGFAIFMVIVIGGVFVYALTNARKASRR